MSKMKNRLPLFAMLFLLALASTGCIKFHLNIKINPDGSSTIGVAMGMTAQAKALAGSQGIGGPFDAISEEMAQSGDVPEVTMNRWTEGEYEWAEAVVPFQTLDELNARMQESDLFESFKITKQSGLFKDSYILDAEIAPSAFTSDLPSDLDFDPSGMFEARMTVTLPGEIVESNGIREGGKDSNSLSWTLTSDGALRVHAVSERWDWSRGILLGGGILALAVGAIGLIVLGIVFIRRERATGQKNDGAA